MGLNPTIELRGSSLAHREDSTHVSSFAERVIALSSWTMVLGTIRLICSIADYANNYLEATRVETMSLRRLGWFLQDNHPIVALAAAWPLLLAAVLRRTKWPELLKAVAVTFLILSIGGVLALTADWNQSREKWITVGSFRVLRLAQWRPGLSDLGLGLLGAAQLVLEFGTALRAIQLGYQAHVQAVGATDKHASVRRARFGRLALYLSAGFLILMIRVPVWSAYLEVLNQSQFVREFVLQSDFQRIRRTRTINRTTPEADRARDVDLLFASAAESWEARRYAEARDTYMRLAAMVELMPPASLPSWGRHRMALALNNLAWLLATCPEVELRDAQDAVSQARRSLDIEPSEGNTWNTLGVAYYRLGNWEEARSALYRSMELRNEGDGFDWFFLAMIHAKLNHAERARQWYDKAAEWFRRSQPGSAELYRFQVEAAELLGLPKPAAPPPQPPAMARPPFFPMSPKMIRQRERSRVIDPALPAQ
jgi:tetratricopeptide (TPR) repeat protein